VLYVRDSTSDRGQTVENQLQPLQEAAQRPGWIVVAVHRDEGISGAKGRQQRPGLDALLKGMTRGEYDLVAAWSVCRLGRSLADLIGLLGELQVRGVDLYLHQQALDTSTPSGRMLFGMLGMFSEFERAMIRDRVMAWPGSRQGGWQAPGAARDDAIQGRSHTCGIGRRRWCPRDRPAAEGVGGQGLGGQADVCGHG
jgi:DNA invertase Pin-like site-specific DNA recombinase